jgi:ankyrin repeat protein
MPLSELHAGIRGPRQGRVWAAIALLGMGLVATSAQSGDPDQRSSWDPAKHGGETYEAHQKSQAQAKLVQCVVDDYNAWDRNQRPRRPSKEERLAQMANVREECRKRYPDGIHVPPPEPSQTSRGVEAFRNAIKSKKLEEVQALLDANADPNSVFIAPDSIRKKLSTPALIFSINNSTEEISRLLVERGAAIAATDSYGNTALHSAAQWGRIKTMDLLLGRGADIGAQNSVGYTPLHSAIQGLALEAVKFLVVKGAPINSQASRYGTPLIGAIVANSRALLKAGAKTNVRNKRDETPLALAERLEHAEVVTLLKASSVMR